jgi:hypothetical protein
MMVSGVPFRQIPERFEGGRLRAILHKVVGHSNGARADLSDHGGCRPNSGVSSICSKPGYSLLSVKIAMKTGGASRLLNVPWKKARLVCSAGILIWLFFADLPIFHLRWIWIGDESRTH